MRRISPETREIRDDAIELLEQVIEGSDVKVHPELRPELARFLWLYEMGILFFWLHDRSPDGARTRRVMEGSLALLSLLLPLTARRLPGMRGTVRRLAALLWDLRFWEDATLERR